MIKYIIVTDKAKNTIASHPDRLILSEKEFIENNTGIDLRKIGKTKVINLCSNFEYLSKGYYVSLLAEARGMRCTPNVANIVSLNWKRNYQSSLPELNELLKKHYNEPAAEPLSRTYSTYFGRHDNPKVEPIARRLFDLFRFPIIAFEVKYANDGKWIIDDIDFASISDIPTDRLPLFYEMLDKYTGDAWKDSSLVKKNEKYWIAILHDPDEKMPPSDKKTLQKFIKIGKQMNIYVELITKHDYASLLEYDALFIRETTAINNHTYRFALKAQQEGIPCIDDTQSIIRCCNKVFMNELLQNKNIPVPKTIVLERKYDLSIENEVQYPAVIKIPDGSFSRGMMKVENPKEFREAAADLLKNSEIVICQEFLQSEFDWRVGVLNGEIIFASQYFMAKGHWQIYNHNATDKKDVSGDDKCWDVAKLPKEVASTALKAANLMGNGFYGVDLKQTADGRVVVIEVNDNPNVDEGIENKIIGDEIYKKILNRLVQMIEE